MSNTSLTNAEYRFACIVWANEPIESPLLAKICEEELGWKRTTMYTVLKKLCNRGVMKNDLTIVTSLITKEQVQEYSSQRVIGDRFDDKLPQFIATYLNGRRISADEAEQIKALIDSHKETD